jgi:hypothetical protein
MWPQLAETAFTYDGRPLPLGEVVLAAVHRGEWDDLRHAVARGIVCQARAESEGVQVSADEQHRLLVEWRRERRLSSAQDYRAWLTDRGLTLDDMSEHLRRAAVERMTPPSGDPTEQAGDHFCHGAEFAAVVYQEAILQGRLSGWAEHLMRQEAARRVLHARGTNIPMASAEEVAGLVAAAAAHASGLAGIPPDELRDWAMEVVVLERAWDLIADHLADDELLERCLRAHRLDWQRLVWEEVTFAREDVAREASLWVREDGRSLSAVAEQAGAVTTLDAAYADDADELARLLTSKRPGELIGPIATGSGWRLMQLRERVLPTSADPELQARVAGELLDDALGPHLAGRVEWRVRL